MAIGLIALANLLAPFPWRPIRRWWPDRQHRGASMRSGVPRPAGARPGNKVDRPVRPLRVVRVVDAAPGATRDTRLLISGRMVDVCAELERLAALEAAATRRN